MKAKGILGLPLCKKKHSRLFLEWITVSMFEVNIPSLGLLSDGEDQWLLLLKQSARVLLETAPKLK